uniref:(northern house mosquito) hypothetical protein n=1 Tax=Culex pipiens TaxID=7175 RepID=A0A8D8G6N8_CULPI
MAAIIYVPSDKSGPIALGSTTATDIVCGALGGRTWRRRCWASSQFTAAAAACHAFDNDVMLPIDQLKLLVNFVSLVDDGWLEPQNEIRFANGTCISIFFISVLLFRGESVRDGTISSASVRAVIFRRFPPATTTRPVRR